MTIEPNDLLLFAHVADSGSFSRAADRLGMPKSTVSRRLAALETDLGERLLLRTTRKLTLTDFGLGVLEHARGVQNELEATRSLAQHRQAEPSGRLRVSMPADLASTVLAGMLTDFVTRFNAISLELDLSPRRVDLIGENFDCALRMGPLPDDATLAARRVAIFSGGLYAAPAYLQRHGQPEQPEELMNHGTLRLLRRSGEPERWLLHRADRVWEGAPPTRAVINSPDLLIRMARLGAGIAAVADHYAEPYVVSGELQPVLPGWSLPAVTAWAVFPGRRLMPARTRVFIEAVVAQFESPQCRAVEERVLRARGASGRAGESRLQP